MADEIIAKRSPLLELRKISKFYGEKLVFRNVSCQFERGSISLLAGANGAGKSSLLKIIAGLAKASKGEVFFYPCADLRENLPRIGYLGHADFLYPGLTALENLAFWRDAHGLGLAKSELLRLLERVGLYRHAHDRAAGFSRGMAQKLNLARVLMPAPDLLLLDEPGSGLDKAAQMLLKEEILAARARGAAVIWVSHDWDRDAAFADQLLYLERQGLAYAGAPDTFHLASCPGGGASPCSG